MWGVYCFKIIGITRAAPCTCNLDPAFGRLDQDDYHQVEMGEGKQSKRN